MPCLTYGVDFLSCNFTKYKNEKGENSFEGKEIVIKQQNPDVKTYVVARGPIRKQIGSVLEQGDSMVIDGKDVKGLVGRGTVKYINMVTLNYMPNTIESHVTFEIRDKKEEEASISPTKLSFPAEGGTQTLTVTIKGYNKYDHTISYKDKSDETNPWLSGNKNSEGKLEITALPNTTGKERVGYINAYVFYEGKPNEKVNLTQVKVTQAANEKQDDDTQSEYQIVNGSVNMYYAVEWKWDKNFKPTDEGVTITPNGKGAKVVIQQAGKDFNAEWKSEISFDIDDLNLCESGKAKLSNYRFELVRDGWDTNYGWSHSDWSKTTTKLTSNAPKAQEPNLLWNLQPQDLKYEYKQTIHYDKWKKDAYSEPIENTETDKRVTVSDGSYVKIGLNVKKTN